MRGVEAEVDAAEDADPLVHGAAARLLGAEKAGAEPLPPARRLSVDGRRDEAGRQSGRRRLRRARADVGGDRQEGARRNVPAEGAEDGLDVAPEESVELGGALRDEVV